MLRLPGISLVQLRRFLILAEELHFSRTAERLGISQPLLSEQIKDLEEILRIKLFDRSSRKVMLTPAGLLLRDRVSLMLLSLEEGINTARDLHGGGYLPIRLGYTDEFTRLILPDLVRHLKAVDPSARIHLESSTVPHLLQQINSGLLDLALLSPMFEGPPEADWEVTLFPTLPLSVAMADTHPLAGKSSLRIQQLAEESFIESPAEPASSASASEILVNRLFSRHGIRRRIVQRLDDPHLAVSLAAAGVGLLIANFTGISQPAGVKIVPLADGEATLTCGAISRASNHTSLLQICRTFLKDRATALGGDIGTAAAPIPG